MTIGQRIAQKRKELGLSQEALGEIAESVAYFANTEGLTAHAKSATVRIEEPHESLFQ